MFSKEDQQILDQQYEKYRQNRSFYEGAIGRYKGWALLDRNCKKIIEKYGFASVRDYYREKGWCLLHWSDISFDPDDDDYALREGFQSI